MGGARDSQRVERWNLHVQSNLLVVEGVLFNYGRPKVHGEGLVIDSVAQSAGGRSSYGLLVQLPWLQVSFGSGQVLPTRRRCPSDD